MGQKGVPQLSFVEKLGPVTLTCFQRFFSPFLPLFAAFLVFSPSFASTYSLGFGPIFDRFPLTFSDGYRSEALGPVFGWQKSGNATLFNFSPVLSFYKDPTIPQTEFEIAYPIITFDKFGEEYRLQLMQLISWSGGESLKGGEKDRTTLFPFYFQQRSPIPEDNYTALFPFYGYLKNRFFRDEIFFVLWPGYVQTRKRDVVTDNYLLPIVHLRRGDGLRGWQVWPLVGAEKKVPTQTTNNWGDVVTSGGHEKFFALWPIYFNNTLGIGTTNVQEQFVFLPFYTSQVSPMRVSKSYGFPLGYTHTIDREKKYEEWDAPWPLVVFARGEGKHANRIWPFFSQAKTPTLQSDFYAWPIYKYNAVTADPLHRERTRILFFLYSDLIERNTTNRTAFQRRDLWPLFTWRKEHNNNSRLQIFAPLEPLLPGNKSIERVYSPVWSVWRSERNVNTGASSKSWLWNLYREDERPGYRRHSALFGLFHRERTPKGTKWRIFFIPFHTGKENDER